MKSTMIECEGVLNVIDSGVEDIPGKGFAQTSEQGDESYTDSAKTTLKVRKQIGDGMGVQPHDGVVIDY